MTEEERDNGLESLFRNRLEENEVVAGSGLTGRVMRRLDRREFLRFNPARLNIWYILAVAAGVTVAGLLLTGKDRGDTEPPVPVKELSQTSLATESVARVNVTSEPSEITVVTETTEGIPQEAVLTPDAGATATTPATSVSRAGSVIISHKAEPVIITVHMPELSDTPVTTSLRAVSVDPSVVSGCVPLHVHFTAATAGSQARLWNFGDGGTSKDENPYYVYDIPGKYPVTLTITDSRGRVSTATSVIEAWDNPRASFEIKRNDNPGENGKLLFINNSEGAINFLWDFGDGTFSGLENPLYRYGRTGRYDVRLFAYSANGCADSVTVSDVLTDEGLYLRFPNAFVPGTAGPTGGYYNQRTDEFNQVFHPVASGVDSYNLKIYSKAGMLVFESSDLAIGWDGYYRGALCSPGVYVWKVRGTFRNGEQIIMAGDVTLINY